MDSPNETVWFYIRDHQQQGPIGTFELKKMFEHGMLKWDSFVWTKEFDTWKPAGDTVLFKNMLNTEQYQPPVENLAASWVEKEKDAYPAGRPLVRSLARLIDLSICSIFLITLVSIFFPAFIIELSGFTIYFFSLILWVVLEPFILTVFGTTIGKAFLNEKLRTVDGNRIDFSTAIQRSIFVSAAGMGLGVPLINFICGWFSYKDLKKHGRSTWDQQIGTIVLYGQVTTTRLLIASLFPLGMLIAGIVVAQ